MNEARSGRWLVVAFFSIALVSYLWKNDFPYFYHSDEESKALQILQDFRNYWHPLLLINLTDLAGKILGMGEDPQRITELGRTFSALFAAIGVAAFTWLGFKRSGLIGGVITGCFLLSCSLLFEVGHYAKEDAGLVMGLALTLAAGYQFWQTPHNRWIIAMAAAVGLAISAKFPGLILLPVSLIVLITKRQSWSTAGCFFGVLVTIVLAINWQWTFDFHKTIAGFQRESILLAGGHDGVKGEIPHFIYFQLLAHHLGHPMLALAILGALWGGLKNRHWTLESLLGISVLVLLVAMSFSPKVSDRYLIPILVSLLYLAAQAVAGLSRLANRRWLAWVAMACGLWLPIERLVGTIHDFQRDSRSELMVFLQTHFPGEHPIATSLWTRLPGDYQGWYFTDEKPLDFVADAGTPPELRDKGFRFVAVADVEKSRFFVPYTVARPGEEDLFLKRRAFYEDLDKNAHLVWHVPQSLVYTLHPGLSIYRLPD